MPLRDEDCLWRGKRLGIMTREELISALAQLGRSYELEMTKALNIQKESTDRLFI